MVTITIRTLKKKVGFNFFFPNLIRFIIRHQNILFRTGKFLGIAKRITIFYDNLKYFKELRKVITLNLFVKFKIKLSLSSPIYNIFSLILLFLNKVSNQNEETMIIYFFLFFL